MAPVMIISLILVLVNRSPLAFLLWSTPSAYILASSWTLFQLRRTKAEIRIRPGSAAVRSIWQVASDETPEWEPLLRVLPTGFELEVSIGRTVHMIQSEEWVHYRDLERDLNRAFDGLPPLNVTGSPEQR